MSTQARPEVQLIVNLVVHDGSTRALLVRRGADEGAPSVDDERWSLPGWELEPYEHPDEGARQLLAGLGLPGSEPTLAYVDSFRGRRGWHVTFNYRAESSADPSSDQQTGWFSPDAFPRTVHGRWEREVVARVLAR
jgi:ADP-ribose pyrophosphatase YjhB (NUDIX family)